MQTWWKTTIGIDAEGTTPGIEVIIDLVPASRAINNNIVGHGRGDPYLGDVIWRVEGIGEHLNTDPDVLAGHLTDEDIEEIEADLKAWLVEWHRQ